MRIGNVAEWRNQSVKMQINGLRLKPMQEAIIHCNQTKDVLVNLPTGFGKSMLFQYPASKLVNKCIIVFTPLRALLWDCLKEAQIFKISAEEVEESFINEYERTNYLPQLLFLTPERLFQNRRAMAFIEQLHQSKKIHKFCIDEAHCVSQWGSDFRPHYSQLGQLKNLFPGVNILAMSATIPPQARNDLVQKLQIPFCYYFQASSNRVNLVYEIEKTKKTDLATKIKDYLNNKCLSDEHGIIYCQTIKNAELLHKSLKKIQVKSCLFHSKLPEHKRQKIFQDFMSGKTKIIVATICFGMGVNKKNIRFVINVGVSMSVQNYYQESGRAGRDGMLSYCLLLTYDGEESPLIFLIDKSTAKASLKDRRLYKIDQIKQYANSMGCRKKILFKMLGEDFSEENCQSTCDYCMYKKHSISKQVLSQINITQKALTIISEMQSNKAYLTKIQLANLLKGKSKGNTVQKSLSSLKGYLKAQSEEIISCLIDKLVELKLLVAKIVKMKNKFRSIIKYLKPCTKVESNKVKEVIITVRIVNTNLDRTRSITPPNLASDRFNKFINKRSKTVQNIEKEHVQIQKPSLKQQNLPKYCQIQKADDFDLVELNEGKIISLTHDQELFMLELFNKDAEANHLPDPFSTNASKQEEYDQIEGQFDENVYKLDKSEEDYYEHEEIELEPIFIENKKDQSQKSGLASLLQKYSSKCVQNEKIADRSDRLQNIVQKDAQSQEDTLLVKMAIQAKKQKERKETQRKQLIKSKSKFTDFI